MPRKLSHFLSDNEVLRYQSALTTVQQFLTRHPEASDRFLGHVMRRRLLRRFQRAYGLTRAHGTHPCFWRLLGQPCPEASQALGYLGQCRPPGTDHGSLWAYQGAPACFVSQPYGVWGTTLIDMTAHASRLGLFLSIHAESWHFFGRALLIEWWNKAQFDRVTHDRRAQRRG